MMQREMRRRYLGATDAETEEREGTLKD